MQGRAVQQFAAAASIMTGSTELGPIQVQQDSPPLLDDGLFAERPRRAGRNCYSARQDHPPPRRKMTTPTVAGQPVQLTPLWEYVVRTKKFPKNVDVATIFVEISERLRDPEWEVRQHALRVLVDVLPTFGPELIDDVASVVFEDLIENLGNPAPAVRKGSLDALRIYLLHTPRKDELTKKILHDGMNRADALDDYQTRVARGVILSTPLLLFPSRSSTRPSSEVVREATLALAMRLVQVTHQESTLRSLAKIRDAIGDDEFYYYLRQVDGSMKRNFDLLCDVYGIRRASAGKRKRPRSKASGMRHSAENPQRKDSVEESIKDVLAVDKSWESEEEDSDTSGIAEEDDDATLTGPSRTSSGGSVSSARIVLETEIKFDEETAITMTILEEQHKELEQQPQSDGDEEDEADGLPDIEALMEERRKTPRRVHFGGEIVKLRTPDSEDTESVLSDLQLSQSVPSPPRTRIPVPVAPATRPPRRVRSSSQPSVADRTYQQSRRSASSSPASRRRRELRHTHDANLSPKKSILAKTSDRQPSKSNDPSPAGRSYEIQEAMSRPRSSRRDSITPISSPRVVIEEIVDPPKSIESSFRVCEEPEPMQTAMDSNSIFLGDVCAVEDEFTRKIDSIFGDWSGMDFQDKMLKNDENMMHIVYRSRSAQENNTRFEWEDEKEAGGQGKDKRRSQSAKIPGFEVFPRQERNYILMELSSPVKETSRRASLEDNPINEDSPEDDSAKTMEKDEPIKENTETSSTVVNEEKKTDESQVDSNKIVESEKVEDEMIEVECNDDDECEAQLDIMDDEVEKSALDAKERSSDSSSDGEWKDKEPSWEELGLVDDEVLNDFHNKEDWRSRVRGLERIASALRTPSALEAVEPRLGTLLHAMLGGERSCRVAAAGMAVARIVVTGVSEEALKNRLPLIAWGLARQGGPNAAHLARLTMLRTSPGLFLEKLLQPQCIGARNAKMRENTLQLLIFSLVTFPSTEFKVQSAIDKVVAMVGDRRKRVRHASLDTLAVLSQIYESEDIMEASKRFTKGKQDGQTIHEAIKTRLSRRLLPTVSVDGLVVYGLQISSNTQHAGADLEWIVAGSGSVSPGTGRTRGQLIAMSKMENGANEQNNPVKRIRSRPASEHSISSGTVGLLEKNERTSSWKLLPQSDQNNRKTDQEIKSRKVDRTYKSADLSKVNNTEFKFYNEELHEKSNKTQKPYATPKRNERNSERQVSNDLKAQKVKGNVDNYVQERTNGSTAVPVPRQESRIPIYTGDRTAITKTFATEMNGDNSLRSSVDAASRKDGLRPEYSESNGYLSMHQRRRLQTTRSAVPRMNHTINYAYSNNFKHPQFEKSFEDTDAELQAKLKEDYKFSPLRSFKKNNQRTLSCEKLNKGFDTVIKNSRAGLRSVPHYQYSSKVTETYESIYQRQRRVKEDKGPRTYETSPGPLYYGYDYESYSSNKKIQAESEKMAKDVQPDNRSPQKRRMFFSPFDDRSTEKPIELLSSVEFAVRVEGELVRAEGECVCEPKTVLQRHEVKKPT